MSVCAATVWATPEALGLTPRKARHAAQRQRPDVAEARDAWRETQAGLSIDRLVFVDDTWATTNMTRINGRAMRGERPVAAVPHGRWKTTTFIGALRATGLIAPLAADGAVDGDIVRACVGRVLAPALSPGDIVIMDDLAGHRVRGVRGAIEAGGAEPRYLPAYSPDLHPIEQLFAKLKALLRTPPRAPSRRCG